MYSGRKDVCSQFWKLQVLNQPVAVLGRVHLTLSHEAKVFKDKRVCQNKSKQERRKAPTFKVHVLVLREQELMDPRKTLSSLLCPCTSQYWRPNSVTNWMQIAQNPLLSQA